MFPTPGIHSAASFCEDDVILFWNEEFCVKTSAAELQILIHQKMKLKVSGVKDSVEEGVDFFFPGVGVDLEIAVAF